MTDQLSRLISEAASQYARAVLVVGQHRTGKTQLLREFARAHESSVIDLGAELPPFLFDSPIQRRPVAAADRVGELIRDAGDIAIVDDVEILFDPGLKLDPLKLLQDNARNRTIIAAWPGSISSDELTFAEPGHPEFRAYSAPNVLALRL